MKKNIKKEPRGAALVAIAAALPLAAWVIYRACTGTVQPEGTLYAAIGLAVVSALAAAVIGRSLCSGAVSAVFAALIAVGCMTAHQLGLSADGTVKEAVTAAVMFLLAFTLTGRLLRLLEYRWFLLSAAVLSVAVYAVTLLAAERTGGAALGVSLFGRTVQIFELGKPLYTIVTASVLCIRSLRPSNKLLITLGFTLMHCVLLLAQSELGTMLCILAAYAGQLAVWLNEPGAALRAAFWNGWRKFVTLPAIAAVTAAVYGILTLYPFILDKAAGRIEGWLNGSYQIDQGMKAMVNGGLAGMAKDQPVYIPYADSDMVFPSVVQLFGLVSGVGLVIVYAALGSAVISSARGSKSTIECSVAVGSAIMLTMQAFIAICASTGLMPMTGITLPFVSNGGMSLAVCAAFAGMAAFSVRKTKEAGER